MATPRKKWQRIYLVDRDFQLRYVRFFVLVGILSTALTLFLILYPMFYLDLLRFPDFLPWPFLTGIGVAALLNFLTIASLGVLITHRISGPIFNLVRQMHAIRIGHRGSQVKVRATDDLKYLVRNFNELVEYMSVTAQSLESQLQEINASLEASGPIPTEVRAKLEAMAQALRGKQRPAAARPTELSEDSKA